MGGLAGVVFLCVLCFFYHLIWWLCLAMGGINSRYTLFYFYKYIRKSKLLNAPSVAENMKTNKQTYHPFKEYRGGLVVIFMDCHSSGLVIQYERGGRGLDSLRRNRNSVAMVLLDSSSNAGLDRCSYGSG